MKSKLTKFAQVAGISLALAFTLSCSGGDDSGGGGDNGSSSSATGGGGSSSSGGDVTACTAADNTDTQYCSNGTMKTYGSTPSIGGRTYKTVEIGSQTWMAENLNYTTATGSYCYNGNCDIYGSLYNWETAKTVCPAGWRLPSNAEWTVLINFAGGVGRKTATKLKATNGWNETNGNDPSGNGTDDFGFSALPGGYRHFSNGSFEMAGEDGYWWSATGFDRDDAYATAISAPIGSFNYDKNYGYSVRCIKN